MKLLSPTASDDQYVALADKFWTAECKAVASAPEDPSAEWVDAIPLCDTDLVYFYLREPRCFWDDFGWHGSYDWPRARLRHSRMYRLWNVEFRCGEDRPLEHEFEELSARWRAETSHLSSIERKVLHPAYQRIIGMGKAAVPFVLMELKARGGFWFWALHHMTGEDPAHGATTIGDARAAWLSWGIRKGFLSPDE